MIDEDTRYWELSGWEFVEFRRDSIVRARNQAKQLLTQRGEWLL